MRARAPGKVVLSGAYVVLDGAPAVVAAVDRYVVADTGRDAPVTTAEVAAAIRLGHLPAAVWFDASALRTTAADGSGADRKLGLGSSAAIVVASLGAWHLQAGRDERQLADAVLEAALAAHRAAQGGGSGIDVAASCHGGVLRCRLAAEGDGLQVAPTQLPGSLVLEVFAAAESASTPALLDRVRRWQSADERGYAAVLEPAHEGAERAAQARTADEWIGAFELQQRALAALGEKAGAPIVTPAMATLARVARDEQACFGPSGAGGGDVGLYVGKRASSDRFRARAREVGLCPLPLTLGAPGVHSAEQRSPKP